MLYSCLVILLQGHDSVHLLFFLQAPLHPCKPDGKDCHENATCFRGKCHCLSNTTGNGKYCRGNIIKRYIVKSADSFSSRFSDFIAGHSGKTVYQFRKVPYIKTKCFCEY